MIDMRSRRKKTSYTLAILFIFIMSLLFVSSGCSAQKEGTAYIGAKKSCVQKYKLWGYQQWEAVMLCKRIH